MPEPHERRPPSLPAPPCARPSQSTSPIQWLTLGCILLAGLLFRGLYFNELVHHPDYYSPARDAEFHDYWARALVTGDWTPTYGRPDPHLRTTPFLRPPGYPYFLALLYRIGGISDAIPRIAQMMLGLAGCLLAFTFSRRWYGSSVALVLAGLTSLYWVFVYYEGELHAPALLIVLLWLVAILTARWVEHMNFLRGAAAGVLLGLAALVRPNVFLLAPTLLIWGAWLGKRHHRARSLIGCGIGLIMGMAAAIAPVTIRNYRASGDWVLITSNAGVNLYIGNNPNADGFFNGRLSNLGNFGTCYDYPALVDQLESQLGKKLTASQVSAYFTGQAIRWIRSHPLDFLRVTATKMIHFWAPREVEHNKSIRAERAHSTILRIVPGNFGFVVGACLVGIVLLMMELRRASKADATLALSMRQRWEVSVLIMALVFTFFLSIIPFFISARFRVPIIPFLLLFAAIGLCRIAKMLRRRAIRSAALLALTVIALSGWAGWPKPVSGDEWALWHLQRARAYDRLAQNTLAIQSYQRAVHSQPTNLDAHFGLANALNVSKRYKPAARQYRIVLSIDPQHAAAKQALANLRSVLGDSH